MRCRKVILGLAVLALPALARAQAPVQGQVILARGDTVLGIGGVTDQATIDIVDSKMWVSFVTTTWPDNLRDQCILRSGFLTLREGANVVAPVGNTISGIGAIQLTNSGHLAMIVSLRPANIQGAYWNLKPVALKAQKIISPHVPANTQWQSMTIAKLNAANEMYVMGKTDINGSGARKDILVRYNLDAEGNVLSETVLAAPLMEVPALQSVVTNLATAIPTSFTVNKHGDWITYIGCEGTAGVMINMETLLAQEGAPAPNGRPWRTISQTRTAINDRGDYVFSGVTGTGSTEVSLMVRNGVKFVEEGEVLPTFSPNGIRGSGGSAPVEIANNGDVFWRCQVGSGSGSESAFMRNRFAIIVENRTVIAGKLVNKTESNEHALASSPNGRFLACRVELGNDPTVLLADFGLVLDLPGCFGNLGVLKHEAGRPIVGDHLVLSMDNAQGVGALAKIVFSSQQRNPGSDCGLNTIHGELFTSAAHRVGVVNLAPWNGTGPTSIDLPIPNEIALVDAAFIAQGFFRMPATRNFRLTNGMRIEFAAP